MNEQTTPELARHAVVQQHEIPEEIRALVAVHDYVDLFVAKTTESRDASPEQWARTAMEGASVVGRFFAWRVACGLRLEPRPSPDHVAGWKIADRGENWIRMEASSWFMTAHIVFRVDDEHVSFATFIRYDRRLGTLVWTPVSIIHRAVAPDFLRAAVKRIERGR